MRMEDRTRITLYKIEIKKMEKVSEEARGKIPLLFS